VAGRLHMLTGDGRAADDGAAGRRSAGRQPARVRRRACAGRWRAARRPARRRRAAGRRARRGAGRGRRRRRRGGPGRARGARGGGPASPAGAPPPGSASVAGAAPEQHAADEAAVARFLRSTPGLPRALVGDLLGELEPRCLRVLDAFTRSFDFRGARQARGRPAGLLSPGARVSSAWATCQHAPRLRACRHAVRGGDPAAPG